ncbi:UNVERIFIED_CONTAM: hypothetical protein HDU68_010072 [Siphonaria sp. JEL0065]|nr:hypothetical protein HDU68_010072 [Siphonaria sp. JEL0065]
MEFTAAEQKTLDQREFLEKAIANFNATTDFKVVNNQASEEGVEAGADDRDIVICVRARPVLPIESQCGIFPAITTSPINASDEKVYVHSIEYKFNGLPKMTIRDFRVDHAFDVTASNEEVYEKAAKSLIPIALGGGVGSLFASGQTGSGKTHTMTAIENLIAHDLFRYAREYRSKNDGIPIDQGSELADFEFRACFFELLGVKARDLLNYPQEVEIMEDILGQVVVKGVTEEQVRSPEELTSIIARGSSLRKTAGTAKNDTSSRSHAICRITIKNTRVPEADEGVLYLLDLAGSESASDSRNHDKERMQESVEINKCLTTLKDCIRNRALAVFSTNHVHVPYRNSKLTVLLKPAFELSSRRACKTVVIATLNPNVLDTAHSLNTLRYVSPLKVKVPPLSEFTSPNDPSTWTNAILQEWVKKTSKHVDPLILCPVESGKQLLKLPEATFIERCLQCPGVTVKSAQAFYSKFWRLVVDGRTKVRREKEDAAKKIRLARAKANDDEFKAYLGTIKSPSSTATRERKEKAFEKLDEHMDKLLEERADASGARDIYALLEKIEKGEDPVL